MADERVNYVDLVDRLGGDLVTLQSMKKDAKGVSPGKYLVVDFGGKEARLDPPLISAIDKAIKDALAEGSRGGCNTDK